MARVKRAVSKDEAASILQYSANYVRYKQDYA